MLQKNGVEVIVVDHDNGTETPDAVFPNNWFTTHQNGDVYLYPMNAMNRRLERKLEIFDTIKEKHHLRISNIIDFTQGEKEDLFLEGHGKYDFRSGKWFNICFYFKKNVRKAIIRIRQENKL